MKRSWWITILIILFVFSGCQTEQDKLYDEVAGMSDASNDGMITIPNAENPEMSGDNTSIGDNEARELTLKVFQKHEQSTEYKMAQLYMKEHPNVTINFDYEVTLSEFASMPSEEREQVRSSYDQRLKTELMSGKADYVLYNTHTLDTYKMAKSGILLDLRPYLERDVDMDNFFTPIFDAFSVDGKLVQMPLDFNIRCAFLNRKILEDVVGVSSEGLLTASSDELLNWYESALDVESDLQFGFSAPGKNVLFATESPAYIDLDLQTANFLSPDFITYLNRTNKLIDDEPVREREEIIGCLSGPEANQLLKYKATGEAPDVSEWRIPLATEGRVSFASFIYVTMMDLMWYQQPMEYMVGPVFLNNSRGQIRVTTTSDLCIPSSISDPDLAWDFIKFCMNVTECVSPTDTDIPINKEAFMIHSEYIPLWFEGTSGYGSCAEPDSVELLNMMEGLLSQNMVNDQFYYVDVTDILTEYYVNQLLTPEQCAEKIQNKVELWLHE